MEKYKATRNNNESNEDVIQPEKSQDQRNAENNANNIQNLAKVAKNAPHPYLKAAGYAVEGLDKVIGGKFSKGLGETMNKANKMAPGGKQIQNLSNKVSESGVGDKVGTVADMKSGTGATGAAAGASKGATTGASKAGGLMGGAKGKGSGSSSSNADFTKQLMDKISPAMKIKIYAVVLIVSFFLLMFMTVFADQDEINLSSTNNTTMSGSSSGGSAEDVTSSMYDGAGAIMMINGETLLLKLGNDKLNEINDQIVADVDGAGRGTGAGVSTAAYDFIKLLLDNGINMTYTYGGGHGTVMKGLQGDWGYGNGLDCSSFVSWALYNGGCDNFTTSTVSGTMATYGAETTADKLKAGDIIANEEHVMLVMSNTGSAVVVAHARGQSYGIVFSEMDYNSLSNYSLRDMTSYYQQNCTS